MQVDTKLLDRYEKAGQAHVFRFWDTLDANQRAALLEQLASIDLPMIEQLWSNRAEGGKQDWGAIARKAVPPPAYRSQQQEGGISRTEAIAAGENCLRKGEVGMILVAGGQGSRLGFEHPKGMFPLGPVSNRTLFQILIDRLRAISQAYGTSIPLYLMTSPATHDETIEFLESEGRFGLAEDDLKIFCQGTMPSVDAETGKLILAEKGSLFLSPDGHGGMLAAFERSGCLADVTKRGISKLFYCQIDNPLAQICDQALLGYHELSGSEMTSQVVNKSGPFERVGNVVSSGGEVQIIEYSDFPEDVAQQTEPDGSLRFWAGSIAVHVFEASFLKSMAQKTNAMPVHIAKKKVPFIDGEGNLIKPDEANAIKFEKFIFDLLPSAKNAIVVEAQVKDAFAPVKNAETESFDTAKTAQSAMVSQARRWLASTGVSVADGIPVEISPFFALDADELATRLKSTDDIVEPTFFE